MENELNKHKKSDISKWAITFIVLLLICVTLIGINPFRFNLFIKIKMTEEKHSLKYEADNTGGISPSTFFASI